MLSVFVSVSREMPSGPMPPDPPVAAGFSLPGKSPAPAVPNKLNDDASRIAALSTVKLTVGGGSSSSIVIVPHSPFRW